eukprot:11223506-Lingulodinium_polyedra.AAC.1
MKGVEGRKNIFVIRGISSGLWHAFRARSRTTEDTIEAFKLFASPHEKGVFKLYSELGGAGRRSQG